MDIGQEIANHLAWMENVISLLGNEEITQDDLDAITQHDRCALGKWLNSEASLEFRDQPGLEQLNESHEAFHKLAGKLISALQEENEAEAIALQEQFVEMSQQVIASLSTLQKKTSKAR